MAQKQNVSRIVARLGHEDPQEADAAGRQLLEAGPAVAGELLEALKTAPEAVKRRLVYVLGEIGRGASDQRKTIEHALQPCLSDQDWKVRRNAAVSLGKVGGAGSAGKILERLPQETDPRVRTSMILAFGELAPSSLHEDFGKIALTTEEERNAARKVTDRFRAIAGASPAIHMDAPLSAQATVELWSRAGVADVAAREATEKGIRAAAIEADRVAVSSASTLDQLMQIRTALFPVLAFTAGPETAAQPRLLGEQFAGSPAASEIQRLTQGAPYCRVTVKVPTAPWRHRREWIHEFTLGCPVLVNAATGYAWELIIRRAEQQVLIGARPAASEDARFAYRKEQLPASLHPTLAAAAARLAPAAPSDVVLDPFCGSGTLLAERALLAPYRRLVGLDISPQAIPMARNNLSGFAGIELLRADVSALPSRGPFDLILTNPPYGQRVADVARARRLHAALDDLAATALRPGGRLIVFRPLAFPPPRRLKLLEKRQVDAGGISVNLLVAQKLN